MPHPDPESLGTTGSALKISNTRSSQCEVPRGLKQLGWSQGIQAAIPIDLRGRLCSVV